LIYATTPLETIKVSPTILEQLGITPIASTEESVANKKLKSASVTFFSSDTDVPDEGPSCLESAKGPC